MAVETQPEESGEAAAPADQDGGRPIQPKQLRLLHLLLNTAGMSNRQDALEWCSGVLGRKVDSRNNLTSAEASELIDRLADGDVRRREAGERDVPVQEAIRRVMTDIGQIGIGKTRDNPQQGYKFRGIDEFVDNLSPILARHGVILVPQARFLSMDEHPTRTGGVSFMVMLEVTWLIYGPRGDHLQACTIGQAMDTSDKATNKAMSAAFKYALGQVFAVPNIGWAEGDAESPEAMARQPQQDQTSDLWARLERYAADAGMTPEQFTEKARSRTGMTLEQFRQQPRESLYAFIRSVERWLSNPPQQPETPTEHRQDTTEDKG